MQDADIEAVDIDELRRRANVPRVRSSEVERILQAFGEMAMESVLAGKIIRVPGFGVLNGGSLYIPDSITAPLRSELERAKF